MMLRLLDTFSGIGGFSYAAEHLVGGYQTVAFVEREPFCQSILRKHWPDVPIYDDITTFTPEPGSADVVCGGFPCQDISTAGKQAGIKKGTRSGLFYELMRVVRTVQPSYVVMENVSAILANGLDTVLGTLAEAGFDAEWACIPASAVGACHQRDRWWLVAYPTQLLSHGSQRQYDREPSGRAVSQLGNSDGTAIANTIRHRSQGQIRIRACGTAWPQEGLRRLDPNWRGYVSEPVLPRGDDGLPGILDAVGRRLSESHDPQSLAEADAIGREAVRKLWRRICIAKASPLLRLNSGSDPLSDVPYGHPHAGGDMGEAQDAVLGGLRDLWRHLSQETVSEDSDLFTALSVRAAAPEVVAAMGRGQRVDRLKALGNAVVPQVAAIPLLRVKELAA